MHCRSCRGTKLELILNLGHHVPANFYLQKTNNKQFKKYPLKTYVCLTCWLVQIEDFIDGSELFLKDYAYLSGLSKTWHDHCIKFVSDCKKKFNLKPKDQILEIASNDGTLLGYFKKNKNKVIGIEPTKYSASIAQKNEIETITKFFNHNLSKLIKNQYKKIRLIIANNVVAHVDDINNFIQGIDEICNEETIISIEFQYVLSLIQKNQFDTIYHEHFSYYSLISFKNLIDKFNLKIFDVKKLKTHGGSLRVFLCKKNSKYKVSSNYYKIYNYEKKIGIESREFYKSFEKKVKFLKSSFLTFIKKIKKNNFSIFAYGAAAKGNTFLNYMNLNDKYIELIMDKNIYKQNKLSPGGLIKIYDPKILLNNKPEFILILAWNLKKEIINDLRKNYGYKNKFIVVIPNLEIVN